jgi:hypothetical protein
MISSFEITQFHKTYTDMEHNRLTNACFLLHKFQIACVTIPITHICLQPRQCKKTNITSRTSSRYLQQQIISEITFHPPFPYIATDSTKCIK